MFVAPKITLAEAAEACGGKLVGSGEILLTSLASSSVGISKGALFVAIQGVKVDGHRFIPDAIKSGASAVVVQNPTVISGHSGIIVSDTRTALSRLASLFVGDPSREMEIVGVTGTNGKTTTNWLIYEVLTALKGKGVRLGTLGSFCPQVIDDRDTLTTPDPIAVHRTLRMARDGGASWGVLEASSHALAQHRLDHVQFDVGIFTNLTRDHLDYHKTMDDYYLAKLRLFEMLQFGSKRSRAAVVNLDGDFGRELHRDVLKMELRDFSCGSSAEATVQLVSFEQGIHGSVLSLKYLGDRYEIRSGFVGAHNASNLAGVFAACVALGLSPGGVAQAIGNAPQVPGRLQIVPADGLGVYVDYAHTPDALENVLRTLRPLTKGKLWVVFGCGGDRDKGKRPQMAKIADSLADRVIVTSDNPRTERPEDIIRDVLSGGCAPFLAEVDRAKAIEVALTKAQKGDIVLIAGKGHEDYQIIGVTKHHFSDVEVASLAVAKRG